jgi:hypothetical protein
MLKIAAEGGPEKNRVYCPIPPLKPFKFASRHLFSCSGSASGFCSRLVLFQKNHLFCLLFHFISKTPPHPPSHLRPEQPRSKESSGIVSYGTPKRPCQIVITIQFINLYQSVGTQISVLNFWKVIKITLARYPPRVGNWNPSSPPINSTDRKESVLMCCNLRHA